VCTVCSKRGHNTVDCWDQLDADQATTWPRRLATRRRRTCPSASRLAKKQRLTPQLLFLIKPKSIKPWRPLRPPRTRTTPRVMRLYTAACLIKSSCLIRPALYLIAARKSTSLKEPSDQAPAFSLPVSQALQLSLKEQMPCSPYSPQMDRATLFQFVARKSSPHARQITSCLLPSCSRQDTKSNFALARTLTPSRCESTAGIPAHQNPFAALLNIPENVACTRAASQPSEVSPLELSVADQIRLCHDRDGHPSYNTHLRMYKSREGRGYPANFPSLFAHFKCETCAVTLGARTYSTSKRVQDKGYHTNRQQESKVILTSTSTCSPLKCACCAERRGASRYLSSGYMLGPCESAKEEEEEVQEGQGDCHRSSS
jgi:hypothetical protein